MVVSTPLAEARNHHIRQSAQIAAPQSAHSATERLLHGDTTSLSLRTCSIWQR